MAKKKCTNCELKPHGFIMVDDVRKPICSKCGRKLYENEVKMKFKILGISFN